MSIPRGTTPTFVLTFGATSGVDLTAASNVYVTFKSADEILTKTGADVVVEALSASVYLTQAETLSFREGNVDIQINWTLADGSRFASEIVTYTISRQLLQKVVE